MGILGGHGVAAWALFNLLILALLALDLGVINRKAHVIGVREAIFWNVVWTVLGLAFGGVIAHLYGRASGLEYVTGYVIERALSIDNIFVFVLVFRYFGIPGELQHRVLYWGILGALLMRAVLIFVGAAVVLLFHGVLLLFGAFLVYTGIMLMVKGDETPHPERNIAVRMARKFFPLTHDLRGQHFFVRTEGRLHATPLLIVLLVLETTDLVFALDSIPAIFGVTQDTFVIYTSNVFAILGLRAMYFLLAAMLPHFRFLKHGLSAILSFIGARMLLEHYVKIPTGVALLLVCAILGIAVLASLLPPGRKGSSGKSD